MKNKLTTPKTLLAAALAALAVPAVSQDLVLEEVIVTATKRLSTLQDIASTVNVVTGESIDEFSALGFADLESQTAGLSLATPNARSQTVAMRGVSVDAEAGVDATVTIYMNDVLVTNNIAFSQLYDLERVEVLRGPQGALQGRSSPAGAININTRSADLFEPDGYVQATIGDNDGINGQVAYGMPLIEGKLAARIAAVYDTNNATNVENITTGLDDPELEATSYRLNTVWQVTDNLSADFTYQTFDRDGDDPLGVVGVDSLGERPTLNGGDRVSLAPTVNKTDFEYDFYDVQINWEIGGLDFTSVTGYTDETRIYREEIDKANYVQNPLAETSQTSVVEQSVWVQELRLSSSGNDFWDWMIGFYYQDSDVDAQFVNNTTTTLPAEFPAFQALGGYQFTVQSNSDIPLEAEQMSVFTFNSFYLSETLSLELGLRYTEYEKFRATTVTLNGFPYLPDVEGVPDALQDVIKEGITGPTAAAFPIEGVPEEFQNIDDDEITGALTLRWDYTDDISLYANYGRAYRTPGNSIVPSPNVQFIPNPAEFLLHDGETSDAFELGMKGRFWGGRASLNAAVYYQQYEGYLGFVRGVEVLDDTGNPLVLPGGLIYNGDADVMGVEFDGQILLGQTWSMGYGLSWNQAEWDGASEPCNDREPGEIIGSCDLDGEKVGGEPEWSGFINSEYYWPLDSTEGLGSTEIYVRGLYKYTGERDNISASAGLFNVVEEFDDYHLFDLFVGWRQSDMKWDVNVFAKNLFDSDEIILQDGPDQYDQFFSGGSYRETNVLRERIIGVMARYNF